MANIDIILETGLINDYGVFNLNKKQLENLNVDIVTDGNQFVESEEAKYQHGGESNFKDHEGIKPIDLEEDKKATWDQYGTILNDELKKYIESKNKYIDIGIINGQQDVYDFILGIC